MKQFDRLLYVEREGNSWLNNLVHKVPNGERFYSEVTLSFDRFPYKVIFIRSGLENEVANRWNQSAFAKCYERFGNRGTIWSENRALAYYFRSKRDAFWFKMTCAFDVLQF